MKQLFSILCIFFFSSSSMYGVVQDHVKHQEYEVTIHTPDTLVLLAGTLLVPDVSFNGTVVLMITGSGNHTRDQVISGTPMFKVLAEQLAEDGIASLRLDDRGTAASTGPTASESTSADRVEDMIAAMEWLRRGDIKEFSNFGILGHSEGSLITIKMAAKQVKPDFAILLAAPTRQGGEVWVSQQLEGLNAGGYNEETIVLGERYLKEAVRLSSEGAAPEEMIENTKLLFQLIGMDSETEEGVANIDGFISHMGNPWMRYFLMYDPTSDLHNLTMPVFAVYGSHDQQTIPSLNAPNLLEGLLESGNSNFVLKVMPDQDHFFLRKPGAPVGEHTYQEMVLSEELMKEIIHWIQNM